jgi:hypothetical protein
MSRILRCESGVALAARFSALRLLRARPKSVHWDAPTHARKQTDPTPAGATERARGHRRTSKRTTP